MEVPIPTRVPRLPELGKIALGKSVLVEVAQWVSAAPPPPASSPSQRPAAPVRAIQVERLLPKVTVLLLSTLRAKFVEVAKVEAEEVAR